MDAIQEFEQYCALHPDPWYSYQAEQKAFFLAELQAILREELRKPWPPLQLPYEQSTPPAPQAPKEQQPLQEEETRPQPLYQATVEDDTETTPESKSTLSTKARLCTAPASRDPAACLSNLLAVSFGSLFGFLPTSFFGSLFLVASQFGYIRCMDGMEATGQG